METTESIVRVIREMVSILSRTPSVFKGHMFDDLQPLHSESAGRLPSWAASVRRASGGRTERPKHRSSAGCRWLRDRDRCPCCPAAVAWWTSNYNEITFRGRTQNRYQWQGGVLVSGMGPDVHMSHPYNSLLPLFSKCLNTSALRVVGAAPITATTAGPRLPPLISDSGLLLPAVDDVLDVLAVAVSIGVGSGLFLLEVRLRVWEEFVEAALRPEVARVEFVTVSRFAGDGLGVLLASVSLHKPVPPTSETLEEEASSSPAFSALSSDRLLLVIPTLFPPPPPAAPLLLLLLLLLPLPAGFRKRLM